MKGSKMGIKKIFQFILVGVLSGCSLLEPPKKEEKEKTEARQHVAVIECDIGCVVRNLNEAANRPQKRGRWPRDTGTRVYAPPKGRIQDAPEYKPRRKAPRQTTAAERNRQAAVGAGWQKLSNGNCRLGSVTIIRGGSNVSAGGKRFNCR